MNDHEAGRIAAALNQARPDWPTAQLKTLLRDPRIADRPRRDVFVALAWVACESNTATPYRVLEGGPWWKATGVDGDTTGRREVYDRGTFCGICQVPVGRHSADDHAFISVHEYEKRVADDPAEVAANVAVLRDAVRMAAPKPVEPRPKPPPNPAIEAVRAQLAQPTEETAVPITAETLPDERVTK